MLDTTRRIIMGKPITDAKKHLDDMQKKNISVSRKVNSITEENNENLTAKIEELICIMKGKEEIPMNVITDAEINNVSFIARNTYNPA